MNITVILLDVYQIKKVLLIPPSSKSNLSKSLSKTARREKKKHVGCLNLDKEWKKPENSTKRLKKSNSSKRLKSYSLKRKP